MSLREELEKVLGEQEVDAYGNRAKRFLRDHGQALVECVRDADRYRWLRDNDDPSGEVPYITRQVCNSWGNWVDDVELTGAAIDTAIDLARTKASAGVGA